MIDTMDDGFLGVCGDDLLYTIYVYHIVHDTGMFLDRGKEDDI